MKQKKFYLILLVAVLIGLPLLGLLHNAALRNQMTLTAPAGSAPDAAVAPGFGGRGRA